MQKNFFFYFLMSLLGYSIYVIMDAIGKKLIDTYHVTQNDGNNHLHGGKVVIIFS